MKTKKRANAKQGSKRRRRNGRNRVTLTRRAYEKLMTNARVVSLLGRIVQVSGGKLCTADFESALDIATRQRA